jgi:PQQ-dependent catabolism-associated CXXCW motif protein
MGCRPGAEEKPPVAEIQRKLVLDDEGGRHDSDVFGQRLAEQAAVRSEVVRLSCGERHRQPCSANEVSRKVSEGRVAENVIRMHVRVDDVAHWPVSHIPHRRKQSFSVLHAAACVDDGDRGLSDNEANIGNAAAISRRHQRDGSLTHEDTRRHLPNGLSLLAGRGGGRSQDSKENDCCRTNATSERSGGRKRLFDHGAQPSYDAAAYHAGLGLMCTIASRGTTIAGFAAVAFLAVAPAASAAEPVPEPAGYRTEEYRAPVPATLAGATVLSTDEAETLWREKRAIFIDVLPSPPKPDLPEGTVWREKPHLDIPGSIWLADVGFGALAPEMEQWYRDSLEALTKGDSDHPMVLYCRADCWMSWNAAKRAVQWGYGDVSWYPGGIESWEGAGLPLEERKPESRPGLATSGGG